MMSTQEQLDLQHLVSFNGKTLCITSPPKISSILQAVYAALNLPENIAKEAEWPWRIMCNGRFLGPEESAPPGAYLRVWNGGLKGGKGGFGAMLRAMAKQAGKKPTTDFGACRDLQGRRLRHVNDEIRLQQWQETRERESRGEKVEETKTKSGIEGWHLGVPTWAEGAKPSFMKTRRKTVLCQQWLDARKERKAPEGAPPWWGCPRGRGCDFAHGKEELRGKGLEEFNRRHKEERQEQRKQNLDKYVEASSAEEVTRDMSSAIEQGFKAAARAEVRRATEEAENVRGLLSMDLQGDEGGRMLHGCSWMEVAGGDMELTEAGRAQGSSDFGTAKVVGVSLRRKKWYFEVKLLTAGLMQIGWANHTFVSGGPESGDGIGDLAGSWAYDGVRQQKWHESKADYGKPWKVGDVVGCLLEMDAAGQTASLSFALNGENMGVAFQDVQLAPALPSTGDLLKEEPGFFPAFSLNEGEAVMVNLGQEAFAHPPPKDFKPVIVARMGISVRRALRSDHSQELGGEGDDEGGNGSGTAPINLEEFSCATDLAERYGPNRLKHELEEKGVKCGGTHYQRAARLYSLKRLASEDYPPNLLAKKAKRS